MPTRRDRAGSSARADQPCRARERVCDRRREHCERELEREAEQERRRDEQLPVPLAVVNVALAELLQRECDGRERRDENEVTAGTPPVAASERVEHCRDEAEPGKRDAERDHKWRVVEIAVPARRENLCALLHVGNRGPVGGRMPRERSDHRERDCDQPGEPAPHRLMVAHSSPASELADRVAGRDGAGLDHLRVQATQAEMPVIFRVHEAVRVTAEAPVELGAAGVRLRRHLDHG